MSEDTRHEVARREVVHRVPGMDEVEVVTGVEYDADEAGDAGDAGATTMDVYYPPGARRPTRAPAVVIAAGFPDRGFEARLGCKFKEMNSTRSWARLMAAGGIVAVAYANRDPARDLRAVVRHVRENADALGVDRDRLALWAGSGNTPVALSALMRKDADYFKCAVIFYGYTLDLADSTHVARASRAWGFANPSAGKSVEDLPTDVPLFVARAGRDAMAGLNESLDLFAAAALRRNLPLTLANLPEAPHAFDLFDDAPGARAVVAQSLDFMRFHLSAV